MQVTFRLSTVARRSERARERGPGTGVTSRGGGEGEEHVVLTSPDQLFNVGTALREKELEIKSQQLVFLPQTAIAVTETSVASQVLRLYEALDDYEDTLNVYSNFDIPDEILEATAV